MNLVGKFMLDLRLGHECVYYVGLSFKDLNELFLVFKIRVNKFISYGGLKADVWVLFGVFCYLRYICLGDIETDLIVKLKKNALRINLVKVFFI